MPTKIMIECVDAHHHLWRYSAAEYPWIGEEMQALRRDFLPAGLDAEMRSAGVDMALTIQARQSLEETQWLLRMAREHPFIAGVVGWAPIAGRAFPQELELLAANPKLKGLRHVLQDESDSYPLEDSFRRGIASLQGTGLVYDILIYEHQLPSAIQFVDQHPDQIFVLDHIAKPKIALRQISSWRERLLELAKRPHVYCKLSGMVTEADWKHWTINDLRPYADAALECFGPQRLIAGSDWPVCTLACGYKQWWETLRDLLSSLSVHEQESILAGNAMRVYRLENRADESIRGNGR